MKALLDTHVLIWWLDSGSRLSKRQRKVIRSASPEHPLLVSDISLWEIATLVQLGDAVDARRPRHRRTRRSDDVNVPHARTVPAAARRWPISSDQL